MPKQAIPHRRASNFSAPNSVRRLSSIKTQYRTLLCFLFFASPWSLLLRQPQAILGRPPESDSTMTCGHCSFFVFHAGLWRRWRDDRGPCPNHLSTPPLSLSCPRPGSPGSLVSTSGIPGPVWRDHQRRPINCPGIRTQMWSGGAWWHKSLGPRCEYRKIPCTNQRLYMCERGQKVLAGRSRRRHEERLADPQRGVQT